MRSRGRRHAPTTPAPKRFVPRLHAACVLGTLLAAALPSASALVRLNDGTDQIYVSGSYSIGYSSNINASAIAASDTISTYSAEVEYQRRAGLIGVNASATYTWDEYARNKSYDAVNPTYTLEFDKGTGRETGSLGFSATRSSQSDAAVNLHDVSWDYSSDLKVKYPVISRYFLTGSLDASELDYIVTGGQPLYNLRTYGASAGLFYILSDERDFFVNYRYRVEDSSDHTSTTDNALSFGVDGQVIGPVSGSLSVGYQFRVPHGVPVGGADEGDQNRYGDLTAAAQLTYAVNRRLNTALNATRDFSTTATDATTATTAATLDATWAQNAHLSASSGIGLGTVRFYGPVGLLAGTDIERRDHYFSWNAGITYKYNSHLGLTLAYTYLRNWSNLAFANFDNRSYTLTITSRW